MKTQFLIVSLFFLTVCHLAPNPNPTPTYNSFNQVDALADTYSSFDQFMTDLETKYKGHSIFPKYIIRQEISEYFFRELMF